MKVIVLQHLHKINENEDDIKFIGVFENRNNALIAIDKLKNVPGFQDFPDIINPIKDDKEEGFYLDEYKINEIYWKEGFITE